MNILHIVRRYGAVGGMERYVWELTRELAASGHHVEIVCERCYQEKPQDVIVHELGEIASRPRWLSLLRFSGHVSSWLKNNPRPGFIIHSHERVSLHDVTTFHAQPFASVRDKPFWKRLSLRVAMHLYLERRELSVAKLIVPNSSTIRSQLEHYYPQFSNKLTMPITPGTAIMPRTWQTAPAKGGVIAFVGVEWKRKGLALAVPIVAELRKTRPELEFWVIGPPATEIKHLFSGWDGGYRLLDWLGDSEYMNTVDVLLHPASAEPYGMVIAEAMAAQIPVVISNKCGAALDVNVLSGAIISLKAPKIEWIKALNAQLQRCSAPPLFINNWSQVALKYQPFSGSFMI